MDDLDLQAHAMNKCQDLSGGTKRKLCAAIAMLGSPHLILMDEPTRYLLETLQDFFVQVNNHEIVVNFFHISYNFT